MKEIVISACEIERIIAEKYELNPQNGDAIALNDILRNLG